jgi:hypothetical protein
MVKWCLGIKGKKKTKPGELNQYEQAAVAQGNVISFDKVPDYVKEAMKRAARTKTTGA